MAWVRERTIPTEWPLLVGEFVPNFADRGPNTSSSHSTLCWCCINWRNYVALKLIYSYLKYNRNISAIHNFRACCHLYSSCNSMMQRHVIVLTYLGSLCSKVHTAGLTCWFFTSIYLELCIWPDAISLWIWQLNFVQPMQPSCPGLSLVTRAGFTVMTLRQSNHPLHGTVQSRRDRERQDRWGAKSRERIIFFDIKRIVHT
jgi:hypothetical protein